MLVNLFPFQANRRLSNLTFSSSSILLPNWLPPSPQVNMRGASPDLFLFMKQFFLRNSSPSSKGSRAKETNRTLPGSLLSGALYKCQHSNNIAVFPVHGGSYLTITHGTLDLTVLGPIGPPHLPPDTGSSLYRDPMTPLETCSNVFTWAFPQWYWNIVATEAHTVDKREVWIPLECFLVLKGYCPGCRV